eukprot:TRINITY_DN5715_c0_g1_i1.p1 TRINITY_DN5715_c0_g1~~TRINITY_DN5715_c0_g1_i1.p1  ORF type:complete len:471 (-),score=81.13 TRINITY_DN5715_c0_g1_i1:9-1421(-)
MHVKFIHDYKQPNRTGYQNLSHFLVFKSREIRLSNVDYKRAGTQVVANISEAISKRSIRLVNQYVWAEYDMVRMQLHVIVPPDKATTFHSLLTYQFSSSSKGKFSTAVLWAVALPVDMPQSLPHLHFPFPITINVTPTTPSSHIHCVYFGKNSACLCIQNPYVHVPDNPSIFITVVALASLKKIDLHIPMTAKAPEEFLRSCHVMFEAFEDYLVLWLPGHFLHFLDLANQVHAPCLGPAVVGDDASPLATRWRNNSPWAMPPPLVAPLLPLKQPPNEADERRPYALVDCANATVYEFAFDRVSLVSSFESSLSLGDELLACQLIHMACVHVRNNGESDLTKKFLAHMICSNSSHVTAAMLKEFVLGAAYAQLADQFDCAVLKSLSPTALGAQCGLATLAQNPRPSIVVAPIPQFECEGVKMKDTLPNTFDMEQRYTSLPDDRSRTHIKYPTFIHFLFGVDGLGTSFSRKH